MSFSDILKMFNQGKGNARSHMKNLIEMAAVDGNFEDIEFNLLKTIAKRNGISESQLKDIRNNPSGITFEVPTDSTVKFNQLFDLVHMMSVDNAVHDEEAKLCVLYAIKFGYPRMNVKELIDTVRSNIQHGQTPEETMKRVQMLIG
jgi:uncharacterized tellurite resistance protein B-like protein